VRQAPRIQRYALKVGLREMKAALQLLGIVTRKGEMQKAEKAGGSDTSA